MHSNSLNSKTTIRFRRWSRLGYAVFNSLACCVNIGALATAVSDKTLQKSAIIPSAESFFNTKSVNDDESDTSEIDVLTFELNQTININSTLEIAAACSTFTFNIHPNG